ncbi:DUF2971 domain-containing protein [uncultured Methanobrevibacter sp.]|uniref:DUF2971 domain-containing protein n=1 Tax=uncultured Methanobrevibacter sp. TaxID=253161 RepID=UPI0025E855B1|nr:DUF2971 domain-containing protein [uncultured Methanobrevibacter sp.]
MNCLNDAWKENFFERYFDEKLSTEQVDEEVMNKNEHLKKPLYQYTKVKHSEDLINNNLMFMRNLDQLNDPLEGDLKCEFDNMIKITLDEEIFKDVSEEEKEIIKSEYKKMEIKKYKIGWDKVKETVSIACFSEKYDINPMWAHYADNHKGVCIEYNFWEDKLLRDICFPVYYVDKAYNNYICLKILKEFKAKNRLISQLFLKKGKYWNYEKEWRIVIPNNFKSDKLNFRWKNRKRYLEFLKPKSVYLGYNINNDDKKYMKSLCRDYDIKIYQMIKDDYGYNLKAKPI